MCEKQYKRYVVMGLRGGHLHHIIARRGHTPDDIVNRALEIVKGPPFLTEADRRKVKFDRLYIMEVGDEGTYGNSTNLKLYGRLCRHLARAGRWYTLGAYTDRRVRREVPKREGLDNFP